MNEEKRELVNKLVEDILKTVDDFCEENGRELEEEVASKLYYAFGVFYLSGFVDLKEMENAAKDSARAIARSVKKVKEQYKKETEL